VPLFGNKASKDEKAAQVAVANAEVQRLVGLSRAELAAEIMWVFGPEGPRPSPRGNPGLNLLQVAMGVMSKYPRATHYLPALEVPVREACQLLEHADLVQNRTVQGGRTFKSATTLGESALADGSVAQHLQS
jgi:hypothetical protein